MLRVNDLSIKFRTGNVSVVNNISFSIAKGEVLGMVGESGSGKTVTALSILRLMRDAEVTGSVLFGQEQMNLLSLPETQLRGYRGKQIGMVFQEPASSLNPLLTCGEQVAESLRIHMGLSAPDAREQTVQLFERVKLPRPDKIFHSYPHQLSGGQKQRVMIAIAICCNPSLLIADEPTTSLDVTVQSEILVLLKQIQRDNNMSMLFISHDLGVISCVADRIIVMRKGQIIEEGKTETIFHSPVNPYTKGLIACRPPLDKRLYSLPTVNDFMEGKSISEITGRHNIITTEELKAFKERVYCQEPVLKIENISVTYPVKASSFHSKKQRIIALDALSMDVFPGETLGIAGESGSGKTTLARAISRLVLADTGSIFFKNNDFFRLEGKSLRKMRKHMQMIFQDPYSSLNPDMTIGNAIMEPMVVHGMYKGQRHKKVNELLEMVSLSAGFYRRKPYQLSGGERQRVCIARAIACEPDLLICDEPVSALDVSVQAQILNLINSLKREKKFSCIFISHDLSVLRFMCDRIVIMKDGHVEESGFADQIFSSPLSEYTQKLISSIP